jgi:heavy metal translocating P-type ATPase
MASDSPTDSTEAPPLGLAPLSLGLPPGSRLHVQPGHHVPGRLRVKIPLLSCAEGLYVRLEARICDELGVLRAEANCFNGSFVVEYDPALTHGDALLACLKTLTVEELETFYVHPEQLIGSPEPVDENAPIWQNHLVTATLAVGVAMVGGPTAPLAWPLLALPTVPVFARAWRVMTRERRLNVDFLDAAAIVAALALGDVLNASLMVGLISVGDFIRDLTAGQSRKAIKDLMAHQAHSAWVRRDHKWVEVPVAELVVGDWVRCEAGDLIPVDGVIVQGTGEIDQQSLTGESLPVTRGVGETVFAATSLRDGELQIEAVRVGAATKAARIVALIEGAPRVETRIQNHAEKVADGLVMPSTMASMGVFAATSDPRRFLAMLAIDYGTGMRVSSPTTVLSSMVMAARSGVLIKGGAALEKLAKVDTVVFDKTGTLTTGHLSLEAILLCQNGYAEDEVIRLAAAAEHGLNHPIARAIVRLAEARGIAIPERESVHYHLGQGVEMQLEGLAVHFGNRRLFKTAGLPSGITRAQRLLITEMVGTPLYLAVDGKLVGILVLSDVVKPESAAMIESLRSRGVKRVLMLTGDGEAVAQRVAAAVGLIEFRAEVLPEDKLAYVQELQRQGHVVALVGDGINDSPALKYADVGVAVAGAAEVACEVADIVLVDGDLWQLIEIRDIATEAMELLRQNYAINYSVNSLAFLLAIPGLFSPMLSTALSNGAGVLASLNGLRPMMRRPGAYNTGRVVPLEMQRNRAANAVVAVGGP